MGVKKGELVGLSIWRRQGPDRSRVLDSLGVPRYGCGIWGGGGPCVLYYSFSQDLLRTRVSTFLREMAGHGQTQRRVWFREIPTKSQPWGRVAWIMGCGRGQGGGVEKPEVTPGAWLCEKASV